MVEDVTVTVGGESRDLRLHVEGLPIEIAGHALELRWSHESERELTSRFGDSSLLLPLWAALEQKPVTWWLYLLWLALRGQTVDGQPVTEDWVTDNIETLPLDEPKRLVSEVKRVLEARSLWLRAFDEAIGRRIAAGIVRVADAFDTAAQQLRRRHENRDG